MNMQILPTLSDFTLYEIFFETGTQLGGTLVALRRKARQEHDEISAQRWSNEQEQMMKERLNTKNHDRNRQIQLIKQWVARRDELEQSLHG